MDERVNLYFRINVEKVEDVRDRYAFRHAVRYEGLWVRIQAKGMMRA